MAAAEGIRMLVITNTINCLYQDDLNLDDQLLLTQYVIHIMLKLYPSHIHKVTYYHMSLYVKVMTLHSLQVILDILEIIVIPKVALIVSVPLPIQYDHGSVNIN